MTERFILDTSKGLVEIARTNPPRVQFIHESVRDFIIKDGGLAEIFEECRANFEGESQDKLKQCCLNCIQRFSHSGRGHTPSSNPFFEYALRNVFEHAETASQLGVRQTDFLQHFPIRLWIKLEGEENVGTSLLYVLADRDLVCLLRDHPDTLLYLKPEPAHYGIPLFVALAAGNGRAVNAFVEAFARSLPLHRRLIEPCLKRLENTDSLTVSSWVTSPKSIMCRLAEYGDELLFDIALEGDKLSVDEMDIETGFTPLLWAIMTRKVDLLKIILESADTSVNQRDRNFGMTPLIWAIQSGEYSIFKLLLDSGKVDVYAIDHRSNRPPISWAAQLRRDNMVRDLEAMMAKG